MRDPKTEALIAIIKARVSHPVGRVLVVGCGDGIEAAVLAEHLHADVTGIDLSARFDAGAARIANLQHGDATKMTFQDGAFDLVFSYHALEHIPDYTAALAEIRRVLVPGGSFLIGTPNRLRALGYVGSKEATLREKIKWNAVDWWARIRGRFRNEDGAHAGFSPRELGNILQQAFSTAEDISADYYRRLYHRHERAIVMLERTHMALFAFPSVYFLGRR